MMMKRMVTVLLILALIVGTVPALAATAPQAQAKRLNAEKVRISAYITHLKSLFDAGASGKISHVGIADIDQDGLPELMYVFRKPSGESTFNMCYYNDAAKEVRNFTIAKNAMGYDPNSITLNYRVRSDGGMYCWVLQSRGKTDSRWSEQRYNVFTRSSCTLNNQVKFRRMWKGSSYRYFVEGLQTLKSIYLGEREKFLGNWEMAPTDTCRNEGAIRKVGSTKKWTSVRSAMDGAYTAWLKLPCDAE